MDPLLLLGLISLGASIFGGIRASNEASRQQSLMEEAMKRQLGIFEPTLAKLAPLFDVALQGLGAPVSTTSTGLSGDLIKSIAEKLPSMTAPKKPGEDIIIGIDPIEGPPPDTGYKAILNQLMGYGQKKPGEDIILGINPPKDPTLDTGYKIPPEKMGYGQGANPPSGSGQGSGNSVPNIDWNNLLSGISLPSAPNVFLGDITKPLADQFALLQGRALANASATAAAAGLSGGGLAAAADMDVRSQIAGQIAEQLIAWERQKPELALKQAALNLDAASRAYELALKKAGLQLSEWQTGQELGLKRDELGLRGRQIDISKNLAILETYLQAQKFLASILGQHAGMRGDLSKEAMSGTQGMFSWLPIAMMSGLFKGA